MLVDIVRNNIIKCELKGDTLVVGLSGGPDSVCLLHCLHSLSQEFDLKLYAVHINHMIRGEEADQDQNYAEELCKSYNIKCYSFKIPVTQIAADKKMSVEECGREIRYQYFHKVCQEVGTDKIAVAQNMNDQAETILMRLFRGTGIDGLCGMDIVSYNQISYDDSKPSIILRPLLNVSRPQIEEYCRDNGLAPRIDKTNLENIYTRNKIRLDVIPYLKDNFNTNITEIIFRMGETLKFDKDYLDIISTKIYNLCIKEKSDEKISFNKEMFLKEHIAIQTRVIIKAIEELTKSPKGIEKKHIEYILEHVKNQSGKSISICKDITVYNNYHTFEIIFKPLVVISKYFCYNINLNGETYINEINLTINCSKISIEEYNQYYAGKMDKNQYVFDYDMIEKDFYIRNRRDGDRFTTSFGTKKIKDFFMDQKVDKRVRDAIPILTYGEDIIWILGLKKINLNGQNTCINENTKNLLMIKYYNNTGEVIKNDQL